MKLIELFEHKQWFQTKSLEMGLGTAHEYSINNEPLPDDFSKAIGKNTDNLIKLADDFAAFGGKHKIEVIGKPSISGIKTVYGKGVEPKADLVVKSNDKVFNISVKTNEAYLFSAGSKAEYEGIIFAALKLFEHFYPALARKAVSDIQQELIKLSEFIGANKKVSDYSNNGLNKKLDGSWFNDEKFSKLKPEAADLARKLEPEARKIIKNDNTELKGTYKQLLRNAEGTVKDVLNAVFINHPEFAQCFFWEVITGVYKFGAMSNITSFDKASPVANTVANVGKGWYDVSTIDCSYVKHSAKKHSVRLQNVPRGWLGTFQSYSAKNVNANAQDLADCHREIEFSLKIAPEKGVIKEFVSPQISKNLYNSVSKISSITELLIALQVFPIIE